MGRRWITLLWLCLLGGASAGCTHFGEATAKGAVLGSYAGFQELKKQHGELGIAKIVSDPAFRAAARDLTQAAVEGAGAGYDEAQFDKKADTLVRTMLTAAREEGNEAVEQLITEQGPRLQLVVSQTLSTSIRAAGAELREAATTDGAAAVEAVITTAIQSLLRELDPEKLAGISLVLRTMTHEAGAGLVAGLREELADPKTQVAIGELAKSASAGAREGLLEKNGQSSGVWTTVAILLGTLFVLSVVALIFYIRRSLLTSRSLTVIAQQINKDADAGLTAAEIKQRISERAQRAGVERHLSAFLKDRGL